MSYEPPPPPPDGPQDPPGRFGPPGGFAPPPKRGHALELVLGAFLGGIGLVFLTVLGLGVFGNSDGGAAVAAGPVVALLIGVGLLLGRSTRFWGVGVLIGYFLTLIVLGGACVMILSSLGG